ncbi:restriction endonuclease [Nocardia sp. CDC160]|uniref:restriction endonuclease n=1 Tax=Nocardia sp. CDC160 TaxID=3112166 RepID=UPI002DBE499B|nr:restriction endonuclease [Nocardia sp. CDC160]MEC3915835.1 restriction endonuclease [Nocardia sp. CDC160]
MARRRRPADGAALFFVFAIAGALILARIMRFASDNPVLMAVAAAAVVVLVAGPFLLRGYLTRRRRHLAQARFLSVLPFHEMDYSQFEHAIAALCRRDGCPKAEVTGGANDRGADVVGRIPDGRRMVIQAKRYRINRPVGSEHVQKFGGTCFDILGAEFAAIVTTSYFTREARKIAQLKGIALVDNKALAAWKDESGPPPWR